MHWKVNRKRNRSRSNSINAPTNEWRINTKNFSLKNFSLLDFIGSESNKLIINSYNTLPQECKECGFSSMCKGGDLENRYSNSNHFDNKSVFCDSIFSFSTEIVKFLVKNGYPKDSIRKRLDV